MASRLSICIPQQDAPSCTILRPTFRSIYPRPQQDKWRESSTKLPRSSNGMRRRDRIAMTRSPTRIDRTRTQSLRCCRRDLAILNLACFHILGTLIAAGSVRCVCALVGIHEYYNGDPRTMHLVRLDCDLNSVLSDSCVGGQSNLDEHFPLRFLHFLHGVH